MSLEQVLRQIQKSKFWRNKKMLGFLFSCLIINVLNFLYIYLEMRKSGHAVPLRYNILIGIDYIGPWTKLLHLPLFGLVIFIINFLLTYKVYIDENKFLTNLLLFSTLGIQVILLVAVILIINL